MNSTKGRYTADLGLYELQQSLHSLEDSLTLLRKLLFRRGAKLRNLDKKALVTTKRPDQAEIEYCRLGPNDTVDLYFSYYTKEALENCLNNGLGYLKDSYKSFLEETRTIESSGASEAEKIKGYLNLELKVSSANDDIIGLIGSICSAVGEDFYELVEKSCW